MRAIVVAGLLASPATAQMPAVPSAAPATTPDYGDDANWLCRPGRKDACGGDISVTSVAEDGTTKLLPAQATTASIDCFYVYPTVSTDAAGNSDMTIDPAETNVARIQFAPFRSVCRTFAPMYRQVTLKALRDRGMGQPDTSDEAMAYNDVVAAWRAYLAHDNKGRGVILVGHSQGSAIIKALIRNEIEGKLFARQLVAAYIPGTNVLVPTGKSVGGDFKSTPLCRSRQQTGCVVSYVSFRDGKTPPANSRFGRTKAKGMSVACVNPAAPGSADRHPLSTRLYNGPPIGDNAVPQPYWAKGVTVTTPFVTLPRMVFGICTSNDSATSLGISVQSSRADPRTDVIAGDVIVDGDVLQEWGLHLIDINVALGDLVALAAAQGKAWAAKR
jgi:hypothetical protein